MGQKILNHSGSTVTRFACDCYELEHNLDVYLEKEEGAHPLLILYFSISDERGLWNRVKNTWRVFCGREAHIADFVVRQEDIPELVNALTLALLNDNTSGTVPVFWTSSIGSEVK